MTFETNQVAGAAAIGGKLSSLPFERIKHAITTTDAQACPLVPGAVIVLVTGLLQFDDAPRPTQVSALPHSGPYGWPGRTGSLENRGNNC